MRKHFLILLLLIGVIGTAQIVQPKTIATWKEKSIDVGKIPHGKPVKVEFHFTNTGKNPLVFTRITTTCGCTVASYPKQPVAPGKSDSVTAIYNGGGMGTFHKILTVVYNSQEEMVLLHLMGTVVPADSIKQQK